jgi:hypothetical protein
LGSYVYKFKLGMADCCAANGLIVVPVAVSVCNRGGQSHSVSDKDYRRQTKAQAWMIAHKGAMPYQLVKVNSAEGKGAMQGGGYAQRLATRGG